MRRGRLMGRLAGSMAVREARFKGPFPYRTGGHGGGARGAGKSEDMRPMRTWPGLEWY